MEALLERACSFEKHADGELCSRVVKNLKFTVEGALRGERQAGIFSNTEIYFLKKAHRARNPLSFEWALTESNLSKILVGGKKKTSSQERNRL